MADKEILYCGDSVLIKEGLGDQGKVTRYRSLQAAIDAMEPGETYAIRTIDWPRPIPVSERLPEKGAIVLVHVPGVGWLSAYRVHTAWFFSNSVYDDEPTHWLPMPPAPEEM